MSVIPCNRPNCLCEHNDPCAAGWIIYTDKKEVQKKGRDGDVFTVVEEYDVARPCPTCDPERAHIFDTSASKAELQERLKQRSTLNKVAQQDNYEASRTRTL
jgi:guanylate kinase